MNEREYQKALNGIRSVKKQLRKTLGMLIQAMETHEIAHQDRGYTLDEVVLESAEKKMYDSLILAATLCPLVEKFYKSTRERMAKEEK